MTGLKFSFVFLFAVGFICLASGNPISNFFGKSSDDKAETEDKTTASTASTAKAAGEVTTTPGTSSSCGGLKGFLHICDKNEPTEPPKVVKTRSVSEEDDSDEDSKSEEDESDENSKENVETTESSSTVSESTEGIAKRQVGDPEAPILGEIPPVVADAMVLSEKPKDVKKRQVESESDSDESEESNRRRRDCRDRGDYEKDCRKKREFVPSCFGPDCRRNETTDQSQ